MGQLGPLLALDTAGAGMILIAGAPALLIFSYFFLTWDRRTENSENKDDGQVGLKLVLMFLLVIGLGVAAGGVQTFLHYLLSGTKIGATAIKQGIAGLVSGGGVVFAVWFVLLPRTNSNDYPKSMRYTSGFVAAAAGMAAVLSLTSFVTMLIMGSGWAQSSGALSSVLVFGGLGFVALNRFGTLSGWVAPVKPAGMGAGAFPGAQPMPQQGGYPQQQAGYPPQQGGYPQQQQQQPGGYPQHPGQQQGGYPPAGGAGLPPPPGGGGGYPGGGFPPQGGR